MTSSNASKKLASLLPEMLEGKDPYEVLGVTVGETAVDDATISKAYRKLALKLHPDKQTTSDAKELEAIAAQFQLIKEAKNFLLQQPADRAKYDAQRASALHRKKQDEAREASMNAQRKRMRSDLRQKEEAATAAARQQGTKVSSSSKKSKSSAESQRLNELRKEGQRRRQEYGEQKEVEREDDILESRKRRRKQDRALKEERQVRLKWSRKKWTGPSPSEHSLAQLLEPFGKVDQVEMIGSKGNQALVTFRSVAAVVPCVDHYQSSDMMRAHYVSDRKKRKQHEQDDDVDCEPQLTTSVPSTRHSDVDRENLQDRAMRQVAERQRLMKQMMEDDERDTTRREPPHDLRQTPKAVASTEKSYPFAWDESLMKASIPSPMDKLREMELRVFGKVVDV